MHVYIRKICNVYILYIFTYNLNYMNIHVHIFKIYTVCVCFYESESDVT